MLSLHLPVPSGAALSVLAIGAHPDDIEIGAGGTLLSLTEAQPGLQVRYVVLTGSAERQLEAQVAAEAFLPGAAVTVEMLALPEGRLPAAWGEVKEALESVARSCSPDVVFAPCRDDAHQDHATVGQIIPTVFRDHLCLGYEIPKWDGDMGRPTAYVPLSAETIRRKVGLLNKCFPSQRDRHWWDDEVFIGLARLRGMECRAPYAEAFSCGKSVFQIGQAGLPAASREVCGQRRPMRHPAALRTAMPNIPTSSADLHTIV